MSPVMNVMVPQNGPKSSMFLNLASVSRYWYNWNKEEGKKKNIRHSKREDFTSSSYPLAYQDEDIYEKRIFFFSSENF